MTIKELLQQTNPGIYTLDVMLVRLQEEKSRSGQSYTLVTFQDSFGTFEARRWDIEMLNSCEINDILTVDVEAKEFNGRLSFVIKNFTIIEGDPQDYSGDFTPQFESMVSYLDSTIERIRTNNSEYKEIIDELMNTDRAEFEEYPAAKAMHHDLRHGLIFHTVSMLHHARGLIESTHSMYNFNIDEDLIYTAIILHDYFKTKEYAINDAFKAEVTNYSLIGHITMAAQFVGSLYYNYRISEKTYIALTHAILAHHGQLEFGSPVMPSTVEAYIVSTVDNFDSRIYMFKDEYRKLDEGQLATNKNYGLGTYVCKI